MKDPPRDSRARILNGRSIVDVLWCGALIGVFAITNYLLFYGRNGIDPFTQPVPAVLLTQAMSITYVTIMVCQLVSIIQRRSVHGFFTRYQFSNPSFWYAIALAITIMLVIVYVPLVAGFFGTSGLGASDWAYVSGAAVMFLAIREGVAALRRRAASALVGRA